MLELESVSKVYGVGTFGGRALSAVSDVSFDVEPGEVVSLIGESGSGKSTIGRMILGLTSVTEGAITFKGTDVSKLRGRALKDYYRNVQGVFQDPFSSYNPIFKADRIFSTIRHELFPEIGAEEWETRVDESLEAVGLKPASVLHKYPHQLSGGQLQRLLIARALLMDIEFLVADEIISMLDASTRIDVLNLLADLKARGLSILFITHDLSLGYYISERVVILYRGRIVETGNTERVFSDPRHPYTKMLMASVAHLDEKWGNGGEVGIDLKGAPTGPDGVGCVFYGRCPVADQGLGCDREAPPLVQVDDDHWVACFHHPARANRTAAG